MKGMFEIVILPPFDSLADALYQSTEGGGLPMAVQLSVIDDVSFTMTVGGLVTAIRGEAVCTETQRKTTDQTPVKSERCDSLHCQGHEIATSAIKCCKSELHASPVY